MGFLGFLSRGRAKNKSIAINDGCFVDGKICYKFSNCLIAGTKSSGRDSLLRELVADSLNSHRAVFVVQNGTSLPINTLKNEFSQGWGNRAFFSLDLGGKGFTAPINFFKGSTIDFVQELILLLMSSYREMSNETRSFVERYISEIMSLYKIAPQRKFTLQNILDFNEQWIVSEASRLYSLSLIDTNKRDRALQYASQLVLYKKEMLEYENFCLEIQKQDFAQQLSGTISYSQLNTENYISFLTLDYITCAKQSTAILKLLIHKAINEMRKSQQKTTFVFEDIDIMTVPEFRELLKACQSTPGNNCYFTCDSVLSYASLGYDPRMYCNTYFIFNQSIMQDAEEWSKTSGTHKKDKATQTTSTYEQVYGNRDQGFIGNIYGFFNRNKQVVTGTNHEIIDEYNILPVELMSLPEKSSKVIINTPSGKSYIEQVTWP